MFGRGDTWLDLPWRRCVEWVQPPKHPQGAVPIEPYLDRLFDYAGLLCPDAGRCQPRSKSRKHRRDFFQAGRSLPAWVCGLAFFAAGMAAPEVIAHWARAEARFGLVAAPPSSSAPFRLCCFWPSSWHRFTTGRKPAPCRSTWAPLRLKDAHTERNLVCRHERLQRWRLMTLFGRVFNALHVFDGIFRAMGGRSGGSLFSPWRCPGDCAIDGVLGGLRGGLTARLCSSWCWGRGCCRWCCWD